MFFTTESRIAQGPLQTWHRLYAQHECVAVAYALFDRGSVERLKTVISKFTLEKFGVFLSWLEDSGQAIELSQTHQDVETKKKRKNT